MVELHYANMLKQNSCVLHAHTSIENIYEIACDQIVLGLAGYMVVHFFST